MSHHLLNIYNAVITPAALSTYVTPSFNATNMNKIEQGIFDAAPSSNPTFTSAVNISADVYINFGGRFKQGYNSTTDSLDTLEY